MTENSNFICFSRLFGDEESRGRSNLAAAILCFDCFSFYQLFFRNFSLNIFLDESVELGGNLALWGWVKHAAFHR